MTDLLHVDELQPTRTKDRKTAKQLFASSINDFDALLERFVFYMPVVQHLAGSTGQSALSTDMVSHTLSLILEEHPLVIYDLARPVFHFDEKLVLTDEIKAFSRKLYAVPRKVWETAIPRLQMLTAFNREELRFWVLVPHCQEIESPFGEKVAGHLPVHFFNCYGNRETYYFQSTSLENETEKQPGGMTKAVRPVTLCYHKPIREIVEIADQILLNLNNASGNRETIIEKVVSELDPQSNFSQMLAAQRENELHRKLATPVKEAQISEQYIRECREIIRIYESVFGQTG